MPMPTMKEMAEGKPKSPEDHIFFERNLLLRGFRRSIQIHPKATSSPMQILHENMFVFAILPYLLFPDADPVCQMEDLVLCADTFLTSQRLS